MNGKLVVLSVKVLPIVTALLEFITIVGKTDEPLRWKSSGLPMSVYAGDPELNVSRLRINVPAMSLVIAGFGVVPKVNCVLMVLAGTPPDQLDGFDQLPLAAPVQVWAAANGADISSALAAKEKMKSAFDRSSHLIGRSSKLNDESYG